MAESRFCLACPRSCTLPAYADAESGQKLCPQGEEFLRQEQADPRRHYFSTVRDESGRLFAYRTEQPVTLKLIEEFCARLKTSRSAEERNSLHKDFCRLNKVRLTCIDPATNPEEAINPGK